MSHWLHLTQNWRFLCCHGIKAVTQELSRSNIGRLCRKRVSQHIPTFTNTDVLVRRPITASVFGQDVWTRPTRAFTRQNRISTGFSQNMIHFSRCSSSIWSHKAGRLRTHFTALSIPFYHHVAASVYLLDTTELISGRSRRPAAFSWVTQVRHCRDAAMCHRVDLREGIPSRPHLINFPSQGCFLWFPAQTWIAEAFSHELQHKLDHLKTYPPWPHRPIGMQYAA